jgi:hypothetical protein
MVTPVIHDDCGVARNSAVSATSSAVPILRKGNDCPSCSRAGAGMSSMRRSVSIAEGAMQLMRTPCGARSTARCRVSITTPAFAAAYAIDAPPGCRPAVDDMVTIDPRPRSIMPSAKVRTVM